jgi:hypothetical protein
VVFAVLLAAPLLVAIAGFVLFKGKVTNKEMALQVGIQIVIAGVAALLVRYSSVHDTEVWNGVVTSKASEHVSCEHSYSCNCRNECSGSGNNRNCSEVCDTCYEHLYDVDWNVRTSNGEGITIRRVDRQGLSEPPRFTRVVIGEPTTLPHGYTNYIKASPDSLFRHQGLVEKYQRGIPPYPDHLYDYFHIDKLVAQGLVVPDRAAWNAGLEKLNAEVGRQRQANVIVVLVRGQPQEFFYALEEAWIGGKKNDVILVIGVDDALKPQWATVMAWTTAEIFKVKLRDDVMTSGLTPEGAIDRERVLALLRQDVTTLYKRKPMADFEYLESSITPTPTQWLVSLLVSLIFAIGLTILFIRADVFGEERTKRLFDLEEDSLFAKLGVSRKRGR